MKGIVLSVLFSLLMLMNLSCNTKLFVKKGDVVYKAQGVIVFVDRESKGPTDRKGDVFTDSLMDDFFVFSDFEDKVQTKQDIEKVFLRKSNDNGYFVFLTNNCNDVVRNSNIQQSVLLTLDRDIDRYLHSKKVFLLPVSIEYRRQYYMPTSYFMLTNSLTLQYQGKQKKVNLSKGYFTILTLNVLISEWLIE